MGEKYFWNNRVFKAPTSSGSEGGSPWRFHPRGRGMKIRPGNLCRDCPLCTRFVLHSCGGSAKICRPGLAPALPRAPLPPATPRDATNAGASSLILTTFAMRRTLRRLLASFSNAEIQSLMGVKRGGSTRYSGSGSRDEGSPLYNQRA